MRLKKVFLLCCLSLQTVSAQSQVIYREVSKPGTVLRNFEVTSVNDSILFSYTESTELGKAKRSKWISPEGKTTGDFPFEITNTTLHDDTIYYYELVEEKKTYQLKALKENLRTRHRMIAGAPLLLPVGTILGMYKQEKSLFFLTYLPSTKQIISTEIAKLKLVNQKTYDLPFSLSPFLTKETRNVIFDDDNPINTFKGHFKIKIFRYDKIYIAIDRNVSYSNLKGGSSSTISNSNQKDETIVLILDPLTTKVSQLVVPADNNDPFTSYILDEKLFRSSVSPKKLQLSIYNLNDGQLLGRKEIAKDQESFNVYFRHGRKNLISNTTTLKLMMQTSRLCDASLTVSKNSGKYILQWGTYLDDNGMAGPGSMINPVAGMVQMMVGTIILQMMEGPGINRYFYYEYDESTNAFKHCTEPVDLTRKSIDDYEILQQTNKIKVNFKNYVPHKDGIMATYYLPKKNEVTIAFFK